MFEAIAENTVVSVIVSVLVSLWLGRHTYNKSEMVKSGIIATLLSQFIMSIFLYTNFVVISDAKLIESIIADGKKALVERLKIEIEDERILAEKEAIARIEDIRMIPLSIPAFSTPCYDSKVDFSTWQEALSLLHRCPEVEGYYIAVAKWLVTSKNDYEAAATLLGLAIDILDQNSPSLRICKQLKEYYEHLPNKPRLDENCIKIHEL